MKRSQSINKLSKFLAFMLGRRPDEFGLVPDADGYVKIKDLMKALHEESGWRHVRQNHLHEVIQAGRCPPIEMRGNRIRATDRARLFFPEMSASLPKLLYYPIRRRAYPGVKERGMPSSQLQHRIVLTADTDFAKRLGRRIDPDPVILTVNTGIARQSGATLWRFGERLFLMDALPPGCFSGPPLPKERTETRRKDPSETPPRPKTPGSYLVDLMAAAGKTAEQKRSRRRKNAWKQERKRKNRGKSGHWSEK